MTLFDTTDATDEWLATSQENIPLDLHAVKSESRYEYYAQSQLSLSSDLYRPKETNLSTTYIEDSANYRQRASGLEIFINDDVRSMDDGDSITEVTGPQSAAPIPSHQFLERRNAELSAELMTAQGAARQLESRLDASRTLCDQLQRALVDAASPQNNGLSPSSLAAIPEANGTTSEAAKSPFFSGGSDVAYLAHTSTEVLELQVQLSEKDGQLQEMAAQLDAVIGRGGRKGAGRYLRSPLCSASNSPCKAPGSGWNSPAQSVGRQAAPRPFADVTNCDNNSRLNSNQNEQQPGAQSLNAELAVERARLAHLQSCLAAIAGDMQQRDTSFSRLDSVCKHLATDAAAIATPKATSNRSGPSSVKADFLADTNCGAGTALTPEASQVDGSIRLLALAAASVLASPRPGMANSLLQGGLHTPGQSEPSALQDQVPRPDENSNGGLYPATRSPVSRSLDFITQAPLGGCCAEATQPRPEDTPELASEGTPAEDMAPEEQAKHHVRHVRRLLNKFDRQVVGLKLEYQLLDASLTERDSAIAELRSQLRRTSRAAQNAAASHTATAHDLNGPYPQAEEAFDVSAASEGGPAVEGRRRMAAVAAAAEEAAVSELQTTVNALQRGRIDDARRANKDVSLLRKRATTAEARCVTLQRELESAIVAGGAHSLKYPATAGGVAAPTRAAVAEADKHKRELARVRDELSKKCAKLDAVVDELSVVNVSLEAREQIVVALRAELSNARKAAAEFTAKLTGPRSRHLAGPWR